MTNTNKNATIHQGHGDHMAPFFKDDEILLYINDIIQSSKPGNDIETEYVSYESDEKIKAEVLAMRYESGSIGFLTILAKPQHQQQYEYISGYPYLDGIAHDVVITDVFEWKNWVTCKFLCPTWLLYEAKLVTLPYENRCIQDLSKLYIAQRV